MSFDADKELDLLRRKTLDLAAKPHLPADLRDVLTHAYAAWLPARARAAVRAPGEDAPTSAERRAQGAPMLPRELFPVDLALAGELFDALLVDAAGRPASGPPPPPSGGPPGGRHRPGGPDRRPGARRSGPLPAPGRPRA